MARTDNFWDKVGGYIKSIFPSGVDILVNGINKYINFNAVSGSTGYGFRDNGGVMEFKDATGAWVAFSSKPSGASFAFYRSSGLVIGDGFKAVIPYAGTITGWTVATKDGTNGTITLNVKKSDFATAPTFVAIDGGAGERISLSAQSKNQNNALTAWTTAIAADDHIEITVAAVTGVVTGIYGIIEIAKT